MAGNDESQDYQNITEAEAKILVSDALAIKDLSTIKALAATNHVIHKVFAQLVQEMVSHDDASQSPTKTPSLNQRVNNVQMNQGPSQNGNQGHGSVVATQGNRLAAMFANPAASTGSVKINPA